MMGFAYERLNIKGRCQRQKLKSKKAICYIKITYICLSLYK